MRKRVKLIKLSRIIWKNELEKSYKSIEKRQCLKYNFNVCFSQSGCFWGRGKKTPKINKRKGEVFMVNKIKKLQKENFFIYGADMEGCDLRETTFADKKVLVIGNEGKGISPIIEKNCDEIISIPMKGQVNSLNASVAAAILIFKMGGLS